MIYYNARLRLDGKWDYTYKHDDAILPAGYCVPYEWIDPYRTDKPHLVYMSDQEKQNIRANREKYHDTGHDTKEEACNCYKNYLLDNRTEYIIDPEQITEVHMYQCAVCKKLTSGYVTVEGYHRFVLCKEHNNRQSMEILFSVGESWQS